MAYFKKNILQNNRLNIISYLIILSCCFYTSAYYAAICTPCQKPSVDGCDCQLGTMPATDGYCRSSTGTVSMGKGSSLDADGDCVKDSDDPNSNSPSITPEICDDGKDNDQDNNTDCDDTDCSSNALCSDYDTDGDGVNNNADICPNIANPDQSDTDGDNIGDVCDNCPDDANSDQADSNNDGIGNACSDDDLDGVKNSVDICPNIANPDQSDTDGDNIGDVCDNCPNNANADQADADNDNIGDACEPVYKAMEAVCAITFYNTEILGTSVYASNPQLCEEKCNNTPGCEAYVFNILSSECILRNTLCSCPDAAGSYFTPQGEAGYIQYAKIDLFTPNSPDYVCDDLDKDGDSITIGQGDCNDFNNTVYPGATEICDELDNNCDGNIDEGLPINTYYFDYDLDGYGDGGLEEYSQDACYKPENFSENNLDCDDSNRKVNPGISEICNDGIDNNCDNNIDEAACITASCGDGTTQSGIGEECDDGNTIDGDGCSSDCLTEITTSTCPCEDAMIQAYIDFFNTTNNNTIFRNNRWTNYVKQQYIPYNTPTVNTVYFSRISMSHYSYNFYVTTQLDTYDNLNVDTATGVFQCSANFEDFNIFDPDALYYYGATLPISQALEKSNACKEVINQLGSNISGLTCDGNTCPQWDDYYNYYNNGNFNIDDF